MTTECESVVSPSLGSENLPHPLTLPSNTIRNDTHSQSGISYEGRVSLISPLNSYEATMRVENPSNQFLPHNLHSPPFSSPRGYNFISHDQFGFPFSEDNRRPMFHLHPQSHSTPGSSRGFDFYSHYHGERVGEGVMQIKREIVDADLQKYSNELSKNYTESGSLNSICNSGSQTITKEEERENCENKAHNLHQDSVKETDSALSFPEHHSNKDYITNGDNSPDPISPSTFQENDDGGPCSTESDYPDPREMGEAQASLMDRSFDGSQETFQHGENSKSLRCQFCSYSTDSKTHFSSHLNCHFDHKCMKCEFTTQTIEQLKEHLQEEHGLTVEDTEVFESTRVPRVNSQGKVKTFKCKQCDYVAITKSDFWKHAKTHIKSEKLLSCSKCPFVTEYKHHLEYHLRNHFGSKPYKCNKCTYSCVNKSMLNSHMKSHSNIYQYRCSDCTYATKYCHSLKLHLRKYGHTPAMVLNPDGSPNPVPIIDIYGTRRGPKLKKDENGMPILPPQYQLQAQFVKAHMEVTGSIPPAPIAPPEKPNKSSGSNGRHLPIPSAPFPNPFTFPGNPQSYASFIPHEFKELPKQTRKHSDDKESPNDSNEKMESLNASKSPEVEESLKCELCNFSTESKDILSHHMLLHAKEEEEATEKREMQSAPTREIEENEHLRCAQKEANPVASPFSKEQIPPAQVLPPPLSSAQNTLQEYFARAMNPLLYSPIINNQTFIHPAIDLQHQLHRLLYQSSKREYPAPEKPLTLSPIRLNSNQTESVLDLSKDQTPPESAPVQRHSSTTSPPFLTLPQTPEVSTPPSKHRRKGRAYKLERIALRLSGSGEEGESSCNEGTESQKEPDEMRSKGNEIPPLLPLDLPESKDRSTNMKLKWGEAHQCQYCDIAFKDVVMYTMHMGYHGYKDPFTCNMCGFDAVDKLSFFLHIGRSSHL